MGSVRPHVSSLVERCVYASAIEAQRVQDPAARCDSFRKIKWLETKRQRPVEPLDVPEAQAAPESLPDPAPTDADLTAPVDEEDLPSPDETEPRDELPLERMVREIQRGDVRVTSRPLITTPAGPATVPSRREGNSLTLCLDAAGSQTLVVFGGRVLQDAAVVLPLAVRADPLLRERARFAYSSAVYTLDVVTQQWQLRECGGDAPSPRSDHTAAFVAPHWLLIFGGRGRNGTIFRDFHALSLDDWRWRRVDQARSPTERYWHAWGMGNARLFLFGGRSDALVHGDLHELSVRMLRHSLDAPPLQTSIEMSWKSPRAVGKPPGPRFGMQMMSLEDDQLLVIGGWRNKPRTSARKLDLHVLDTVTLVWSTPRLSSLVCAAGSIPSERMLFESFYTAQTLVVFGGHMFDRESDAFLPCEDSTQALFVLDLARMIWRRQEASDGNALPLPHVHNCSNAVVNANSGAAIGIACASGESDSLELTAFDLPFD